MKTWKQYIAVGMGLILVLLTHCVPGSQLGNPAPTWRGITPGLTSPEEVEALLGTPARVKEEDDGRMIYIYPNPRGDIKDPHMIIIDEICDCVVEVREVISKEILYAFVLQDVLDQYGEPEAVLGTNYWMRSSTFIYATKGLAFTAQSQEEPKLSNVWSVRYFIPMTMEEFLETSFGSHLPTWVPPQWENYQYLPVENNQ